MKAVEQVTAVLFGGESVTSLDGNALDELAKEIPTVEKGKQLFDILTETDVASSSSEARRLVAGGAVTVNGEKVSDDITVNEVSLIKKGKNSFVLVR
jgi:tyrosyl-tRNA synthetase